jgi:hypothetical protein
MPVRDGANMPDIAPELSRGSFDAHFATLLLGHRNCLWAGQRRSGGGRNLPSSNSLARIPPRNPFPFSNVALYQFIRQHPVQIFRLDRFLPMICFHYFSFSRFV